MNSETQIPPSPLKHRYWVQMLICLGLVIITAAVYWPVHNFEFINLDDPDYVSNNLHLSEGFTQKFFQWAFTKKQLGNWHPLTLMSHAADVKFFGVNPGPHHLVNVAFHIFNVLLVFCILHRSTKSLWRSAFVASVFAWHPLHVESVAWISERKDLLSTFFGLWSIYFYVLYAEGRNSVGKKSLYLNYILALLFFVFSLMSKPMLVTMPFLLLIIDFWPLRRISNAAFGGISSKSAQKILLSNLILEKVPFLVLSLTSCFITIRAQEEAVASLSGLSFINRLENVFISYNRYIGKFFWQQDLAVFYPYPPSWSIWAVSGAFVVLVSISFFAVRRITHQPSFFVGWFWFLGTLVPVIGLVQVGGQSMADRYMYFPLLGLTIILSWISCERQSTGLPKYILNIARILFLVVCVFLTGSQLQHWKNSERLFSHAVRVTRNNALAHGNLGDALLEKGKVDEAISHLTNALAIDPDDFYAHVKLGNALCLKGETAMGILQYEAALRLKPNHADVQYTLGAILSQQTKFDEAIEHLNAALALEPGHAKARINLAAALASKGRIDEAITNFSEGLRQQPENFLGHYRFGILLAIKGDVESALFHLKEAVRLKPTDFSARYQLALTRSAQRNWSEAIAQYREALLLNPNSVEALNNLAWILAVNSNDRIRDTGEAVNLAKQACDLTNRKVPLMLGTLAAAQAGNGDFVGATKTAEEARDLARSLGQNEIAQRNSELLELYRAKKAYRE